MSEQAPQDWRAVWDEWKLAEAAKAARQQQTQYGPLRRCYKGHLYTPETQGQRLRGGRMVRKCLVCAEQRRARKPIPRCGTTYAYGEHRKRGEQPCALCREAKRAAQVKYRAVNALAAQRYRAAKKAREGR